MYLSRGSLAEEFSISTDTVIRREKEMRQMPEIYAAENFTNDPPRIRKEAFTDYLQRRPAIRLGIDKKAFCG